MINAIIYIVIMAVVTALLRFLPFIAFRGNKKTPDFIAYLGNVLPYSIMGMLVVFCLKSVDFMSGVHGLPEIVSILVIILAHWWKNNTIVSILSGTICYVVIVNFIL